MRPAPLRWMAGTANAGRRRSSDRAARRKSSRGSRSAAADHDRPVEAAQHLVEQMGAVVVRTHSMTEQHKHCRLSVDHRQHLAERGVEFPVDRRDRIAAEGLHQGGIEARMGRVVEMPLLVADRVISPKTSGKGPMPSARSADDSLRLAPTPRSRPSNNVRSSSTVRSGPSRWA